jgi:hypothetical protein
MEPTTFVGLDVPKRMTSVAIAEAGRGGEVRFRGEIPEHPGGAASPGRAPPAEPPAAQLLLRSWTVRLRRASAARASPVTG